MNTTVLCLALCAALLGCASSPTDARAAVDSPSPSPNPKPTSTMNLGAFSISLAVKDLAASREFYAKLGFEPTAGDPSQNWQILRNGDHVIGLFQGMFPTNILTFNPGWTQQATELDAFTDVREIQARLKQSGVSLATEAEVSSTGPASLMLVDPDGNPILIDQHVPKVR